MVNNGSRTDKKEFMQTRRQFVKRGCTALGAIAVAHALPAGFMGCVGQNQQKLAFGFQTWTLRDQLGENLPGTLNMMAGLGYSEVEFCSPLGYSGTPFEKFNQMPGTQLRTIIEDAGLRCESSHYNMGELRDHLSDRIEWSLQMGIKQIVAASFWLPSDASIDDYRRAADELNEIGRKTKDAGLQTVFHNHHMEFEKIGDELIYDALLFQFDPDLVKMQFQVAVVDIGYHAADYFRKYPGRFISAHLADWSSALEKQVPIGQGDVDWVDFFEAAEASGVQNYYVEMHPDTFGESAEFLKSVSG